MAASRTSPRSSAVRSRGDRPLGVDERDVGPLGEVGGLRPQLLRGHEDGAARRLSAERPADDRVFIERVAAAVGSAGAEEDASRGVDHGQDVELVLQAERLELVPQHPLVARAADRGADRLALAHEAEHGLDAAALGLESGPGGPEVDLDPPHGLVRAGCAR